MRERNKLIYHSLVSKDAQLAIDVNIARTLGFDGIETTAAKIRPYLDAGFSVAELNQLLAGLDVVGLGFLIDVERQAEREEGLMREADELFALAAACGSAAVEVITGPLDVRVQGTEDGAKGDPSYRGLIDLPLDDQIELTARNLMKLADRAADHGLLLYLEGLSWTPLKSLANQMRVIERADRANIRLVIDFWHCYTSGETPDVVARIDKNLIYGVHVCDSRPYSGGIPNEPVLRDVPTGSGILKLDDWVDAVRSTGFEGWWSCELFCRRQHQENSYEVARGLKTLMQTLVPERRETLDGGALGRGA